MVSLFTCATRPALELDVLQDATHCKHPVCETSDLLFLMTHMYKWYCSCLFLLCCVSGTDVKQCVCSLNNCIQ